MNEINNLFKNIKQKPVDMGQKYFLHINDPEISYIVDSGQVHMFCWIFENNKPTSSKQYVASFSKGEIIIGGTNYIEKNSTCGFYIILDHDAKINQTKTSDIIKNQNNAIIKLINEYLNKIDNLVKLKKRNTNKQNIKIKKNQTCKKDTIFIANPNDKIIWVIEKNNPKEIHIATKNVGVKIKENETFSSYSTKEISQQKKLSENIKIFEQWIKKLNHKQLINNDKNRETNFQYLKNIQKTHIENTFNQLKDSYHGDKNITPESIVIDESLGINRIINQLCRAFKMPLKGNITKITETLDCNNWSQLEHALNMYNIRSREITLDIGWEKKENWIMIAKLKKEKETILLKHNGKHYEYYYPKINQWTKINEKNVQDINATAYMLYRGLPEKPINNGLELFKTSMFMFKKDFLNVIFIGIIVAGISLITPIITGQLIAEALPSHNIGLIYSFLLALIASTIATTVFRFVSSISLIRIESKSSLDLHAAIWSRLLQLPISFFDKYSIGDLADRTNMITQIYNTISSAVTNAILSIFTIIALYALLFYYNPIMAMASSIVIIIIGATVYWFYKSIKIEIFELFEFKGTLDNIVFQTLSSINKLRIASKENTMLALWANMYNKVVVNNRKFSINGIIMQMVFQTLPLVSSIIIFGFTYYFIFQTEKFNLATFIAFNAAFAQLVAALLAISAILASLITIKPMMKRIMPILKENIENTQGKIIVDEIKGNVEINNVSFRYAPEMPMVLNNLSINIKAGEYVAIVGASGSGKSTILRLLMGFEETQSGAVSIDGINIQEMNLSSLRKNIGIVLQNGTIMPGSIMENITAGNHTISEDDVWEALKLAGIKNEVKKMPMGIHTIISEAGGNVSGGQLQRLIIARALVTKPNLMFLDEATSAMDNIVQKLVQETLENMDITRIVVAHRVSTIKNVDRIYVMEKGKIVETGAYDELIKNKKQFYQLVKRQQ